MTWFKNMTAFRLRERAAGWDGIDLRERAFAPCLGLEESRAGWVAPVDGGELVHPLPGVGFVVSLCVEKKSLPKQAIDRETRERCAELEQQQGFKPGRKQTKEVRENVIDDMLPKAFAVRSFTRVLFDTTAGYLLIDSASPSRVDDVVGMLLRSIEDCPFETLSCEMTPVFAMTNWLNDDAAPAEFTVDQETELQASGEGKAAVRFLRHTLEPEDMRRHIGAGKRCVRLAMTWADRISFVLTEAMTLKRITPLDVLKERDDIPNFDSDMFLMASEFRQLLGDLVVALGGESEQ